MCRHVWLLKGGALICMRCRAVQTFLSGVGFDDELLPYEGWEVKKEMPKKFEDIVGANRSDFALPSLTELTGSSFEVLDVRFGEGKFGQYAIVDVKDKGEYRTSSKVLVEQLARIRDYIATENDSVVVTLKKVKRYYTF